MKKFSSILFAFVTLILLIFVITSCGDGNASSSSADASSSEDASPSEDSSSSDDASSSEDPADTCNHRWGGYRSQAATCVESAKRYRQCLDCGTKDYDPTYVGAPATGEHTYGTDGHCTVCDVLRCDLGDHYWSNYTVIGATCAEAGSRYRTCVLCKEEEVDNAYGEKFPATGKHKYGTDGLCLTCGSECPHNYQIVAAKTEAPTCTTNGKNTYKCSLCTKEKEDVVPATGHTITGEGVVTEPTCANEGYTTYTCDVCRAKVKTDIKPATGDHELSDWIITEYETDYLNGSKMKKCEICNQTIVTAVIPHRKNFDELTIKNFLYKGGKYYNDGKGVPFVNVAINGIAEASNFYRTTSAKNMVDGSLSTYWQADTLVDGGELTGSYVTIYLAKAYDLGAISLTIANYSAWGLGEGCYVSYKIEAYVDGEWVYVGDISDKDANDPIAENTVATLVFDTPITTDRLRATVTHSTRYAPAKIHEIEVYGFAEEIIRESKNIGANATITISGKGSEWEGGNGTNLVDGSLSKGWTSNARTMVQGDNAITRGIIEFKNVKDIKNELIEISSLEINLDKKVGEKIRLYYASVGQDGYNHTAIVWKLIPIDGADSDGWYTIKDSDPDVVKLTANISEPIITSQIKLHADGYLPEGEYLATVDDYPPTIKNINVTYKACTVNGSIDTTDKSDAEILGEKIKNASATGASVTSSVTDISWTNRTEVYTIFRYSTEQFVTYLAWVVPSSKDAWGKEYKLYIERNGVWEEYANPNPDTDGRYVVPETKQTKYTFNIDINDNITGFKIQMIYEPSNGFNDNIYEVMVYTVVENEVDPAPYTGCKHTLIVPVKDADGNIVSVAPTCTTAGYSLYKCNLCDNYVTKSDAKEAYGHVWGDYTTTKKATSSVNGLREAKCKNCEQTKSQVIPATVFGGDEWEAPEITKYYHNAPAAWSMTLDDGNYLSTYAWLLPRLEEYNFKATAVLALCYSESYIALWDKYFATGYFDLGSHSMTHGGFYSSDVSESALISDVNDAFFRFMAYFHGQRLLGFATPNGTTSDAVADFLMDIMGAGRRGDGWFNDPDKLTSRVAWGKLESYISKWDQNEGTYSYVSKNNVSINYVFNEGANRLVNTPNAKGTYYYDSDNYRYDWYDGKALKKNGNSYTLVDYNEGDTILAHTQLGSYETAINRLLDEGSWSIECIHQLLESHEYVNGVIHSSYDATMSKFEYLKKTGVWVCSYNDAIKYIRERQNATINYKSVSAIDQKIVLELTQTLDDYMFNQELTIKVRIPSYWEAGNMKVTQNGKDVYFTVEDGYCYLDAIPNGGDIVLVNNF